MVSHAKSSVVNPLTVSRAGPMALVLNQTDKARIVESETIPSARLCLQGVPSGTIFDASCG